LGDEEFTYQICAALQRPLGDRKGECESEIYTYFFSLEDVYYVPHRHYKQAVGIKLLVHNLVAFANISVGLPKNKKLETVTLCFGLKCNDNKSLIAIWRTHGENEVCTLPIKHFKGKELSIKCSYPSKDDKCKYEWNKNKGTLSVILPEFYTARILELENSENN